MPFAVNVNLKVSNVDLTSFLQHIDQCTIMPKREGPELTKESFQMILQSADTEYNRKLPKAVAGACKSWKELEELGIDPRKINDLTTSVLFSEAECSDARKASLDIVKQRLVCKIQQLQDEKSSKERILHAKKSIWTTARLGDVQEDIKAMEERIDGMQNLLNPGSSYEKQKVNQMGKRQADQLIKANRVKGRTLSKQSPKEKITESDEEFMAQCIEEKASCHGRRHETVVYTNQREKARDLLNVVNFKHIQEGKKLIKSATTAYNRARPANKRSIKAKRHKGKGLFRF